MKDYWTPDVINLIRFLIRYFRYYRHDSYMSEAWLLEVNKKS
jgi:hypothetical protein